MFIEFQCPVSHSSTGAAGTDVGAERPADPVVRGEPGPGDRGVSSAPQILPRGCRLRAKPAGCKSRMSPGVDILKQSDFLFFPTLGPTPTPPSKRVTGNSQSFLTFL